MRWDRDYRLSFLFIFFVCFQGSAPILKAREGSEATLALPQMTYSNASWRFKAKAEDSRREKLLYPNKMHFMLAGCFGFVLSKLFQILGGLQFHPL